MKDIKEIIAQNLISLRKKNGLTQNELAQKINYSDNSISRWEHMEVTPSIETLDHIAKVFNIPLSALIDEDNAVKEAIRNNKTQVINKLAMILISVSLVWLISTTTFVITLLAFDYNFWKIFVWSIPVAGLVMLPFYKYWGKHIYKFVILSICLWTFIAAAYIQFYIYVRWLWLIFIIGVPIQVTLSIWAFVKPRPKQNKKNKINISNTNTSQTK